MTPACLYIGNRRYSSWSLRAWLVMKRGGLEFDVERIALNVADTRKAISAISPGGTVPVLHADGVVVWDSLAICEWVSDEHGGLWPGDPLLRARARSVVAMMHSGFHHLRDECPMDLGRVPAPISLSPEAEADIAAVQALWMEMKTGTGPWLFGDWSIADAFFTPVATRFESYAIDLHADARAYVDSLLADGDYQDWLAGARLETDPNPYETAGD